MFTRLLTVLPLIVLLATIAPPAGAGDAPREIAGPIEARVIKVRDGDTVEVAAFVWPQQTIEIAVRLRGIDAPELRGACDAERKAAVAARDRLRDLLSSGTVQLHAVAGDKYFGRVLAALSTDGHSDVATTLIAEGLVDPYDGGRRHDWCAALGAEAPAAVSRERG